MCVEDPAGKLDEFADMSDKQRLGKARVDCRFERDSTAAGPWQGADKEPPQELEMRNCRGFKFDRCSFDGVFEPSAQ